MAPPTPSVIDRFEGGQVICFWILKCQISSKGSAKNRTEHLAHVQLQMTPSGLAWGWLWSFVNYCPNKEFICKRIGLRALWSEKKVAGRLRGKVWLWDWAKCFQIMSKQKERRPSRVESNRNLNRTKQMIESERGRLAMLWTGFCNFFSATCGLSSPPPPPPHHHQIHQISLFFSFLSCLYVRACLLLPRIQVLEFINSSPSQKPLFN